MTDLKFKELGRLTKFFDPKTLTNIEESGLSIVSGFSTTVKVCSNLPYVIIDYQTRIIRNGDAREYIDELFHNGYKDEDIK